MLEVVQTFLADVSYCVSEAKTPLLELEYFMKYICDGTQGRCQRSLDQAVRVCDDRGITICILAVPVLDLHLYIFAAQVADHLEDENLGGEDRSLTFDHLSYLQLERSAG